MSAGDDAAVEQKKYECEGSFEFTVRGVSKLGEYEVYSPVHQIGGFGWQAYAYRCGATLKVS